jgi:hypothetical protein
MSEARTKLDILYKDVLGDVTHLLDKVDALKNSIPNVAIEVENQLKEVLDQISESISTLQGNKEQLIEQVNNNLQEAVKEMLGQIGAIAKSSVSEVIILAVNEPVIKAVAAIADATAALLQATATLNTKVNTAITSLNNARERQPRPFWQLAVGMIAGALAALIFNLGIGKWLGMFVTKAEISELLQNQQAMIAEQKKAKPSPERKLNEW